MAEPAHKWSSPLISQYKDEYGRPQGTMNFEVACNAPPGSTSVSLLRHIWDRLNQDILSLTGLLSRGVNGHPTRLCKFVIALSVKMEGHGR